MRLTSSALRPFLPTSKARARGCASRSAEPIRRARLGRAASHDNPVKTAHPRCALRHPPYGLFCRHRKRARVVARADQRSQYVGRVLDAPLRMTTPSRRRIQDAPYVIRLTAFFADIESARAWLREQISGANT